MAIREYVGARYVPRFTGLYDNTRIYDALDVVDNGVGTSYIAKKTVPAGTALTDTNYWFVYGASSGAILDLQNRVSGLENADITITSDINQLKAKTNKQILVIGNSYTQAGVAANLEKRFDAHYEVTEGGLGFVAFTGHTHTFETLIDSAIADATIPNDEITDILFISAVGDGVAWTEFGGSTYTAKLRTSLGSIRSKIYSNFTNVKKISVAYAESRNQQYFSNSTWDSMFKVHSIFKDVLAGYDFQYLGWCGFNLLFASSFFENDNVHPNSFGAIVIGNNLVNSYDGCLQYMTFRQAGEMSLNYTAASKIDITYEFDPESVNIFLEVVKLNNGDPVVMTANSLFFETAEFSIPLPPPIANISVLSPMVNKSGGALTEMINFLIMPDSHGMMKAQNVSAPSQATAVGSRNVLVSFQNFSYKCS